MSSKDLLVGWIGHVRRIANTHRNKWSKVTLKPLPKKPPKPNKTLKINSLITFLMSLHNLKSCDDAEVDNEDDDDPYSFNPNTDDS